MHCDALSCWRSSRSRCGSLRHLAVAVSQAQLIISIAAGLRLADLSRWLGGYDKLVRAMPNTPALIGAGVTGLYALPEVDGRAAGCRAGPAGRRQHRVGRRRGQMDAVTAISGSGPAYVFLFIEALQQAGESLGFTPRQARQLSIETTLGAAKLAAQSDESRPACCASASPPKGGTNRSGAALARRSGHAAHRHLGLHRRPLPAGGAVMGQSLLTARPAGG
jgi:pyrroline-5-carboxylate reductase